MPTSRNHLHLEPVGGAAGDMLLGALLHVGADRDLVAAQLRRFDIPGLTLTTTPVSFGDETALHVASLAPTPEHASRHFRDIVGLIEHARLPPAIARRAIEVFEILCIAEAEVHGETRDAVHLHEVGQIDSILDVVGIVAALHALGNPTVTCAPVPSGQGTVMTEHGELSCPVPAVVAIAERHGVPLVAAPLRGETITPTGAAVLANVVSEFTHHDMQGALRRGAGAGTRRFPGTPNIVRAAYWA